MKTFHVNFGLGIGARILRIWMLTIPFTLPFFALFSHCAPGKAWDVLDLSCTLTGWLDWEFYDKLKKPRAMDAFHLGMNEWWETLIGTVHGAAKKRAVSRKESSPELKILRDNGFSGTLTAIILPICKFRYAIFECFPLYLISLR